MMFQFTLEVPNMTKSLSTLRTTFLSVFIFYFFTMVPIKGQDLCPPFFLNGIPLNGAIELTWEMPDTLGGLGEEVFSACFPVCATAAEGFTVEHMGQDTSGGWFQDEDGEAVECGTNMYACADGGSDGFGAFASWSDTLAPVNSRLSTGPIDLSSYANATLIFDEYYTYTSYAHDSNWVEISTNGSDWTTVYYSDPMELGDGYVINSVDLTTYVGQSIYLGFRFYDSIGYNENWEIDNIRVFGGAGDYSNPCGTLTGYNVFQDGNNVGSSDNNSYTVTGLTNNVNYCFSISAVYSEGESDQCVEACFAPVDPFELTMTTFRDTLDHSAGEYSVFEFSLINMDTASHDFHFSSSVLIGATAENTLLDDDFNSGTSTNFFDSDGFWNVGTVDDANATYLSYPEDSDGAFYYYNDASAYYYTYYEPTSAILQSQPIAYAGGAPVFFVLDMFFPNVFGDCSSGHQFAEDASIIVSTDNGATWTVIDSTFATNVTYDDAWYDVWGEANWHTLMYNITPYISAGVFSVGVRYEDCGGNFGYGIGVDNAYVIQGDETHWLSWERLSGEIVSGDTMSMSLTMMPQQDQNEYLTTTFWLEGSAMSQTVDIVMITDPDNVGVVNDDGLPGKFAVHQNYPNPFNPMTTLRYDLPEDDLVNITIYDMMGREIVTLINDQQPAGYRSFVWNGTNDLGESVSAGIYLFIIKAGELRQTKKMVLLK
ncbi:MAG: hypothetical protein CMG33_02615 [Candidatus Marinimicrobia bacterium]|nr:hypothetical protein [Candidatus Neomarinimicrobiota bacterium]